MPADRPVPYEISRGTAERTQAVTATSIAERYKLVRVHKPYDLEQEIEVRALRKQLGPDAHLPTDTRIYYLVYVVPQGGDPEDPIPVLLPQDKAAWVLWGMGLMDSFEAAQALVGDPWMMPLHDPADVVQGDEPDEPDGEAP